MGGIYYWLPKMTGLKMNEMLGKVQFWTMFIFFNATFLPLFAAGMLGQPRRVFEYAKSLETLNDWVSISAFLLGGSILIFLINFIWSTVIVREPELGNPWQSRGLEWQVPSPPPPGNFARVPVVLSAPYEYGVPGAPPVADLSPPPGVIADEADFYHEASLNAGWAATRLALGALTFLFGTFLFAYFYLRSTNSFGRWEGSGYHPPQLWAGTLIMALIVAGAGLHTIVLQRMKAGHKAAWQAGAAIALAFGVAAVCLQIWQLLNLPFYPGSSGFSSVFTGFYPVFLFIVFAAMFWLETLVVRARSIPAISFVQQPSTRAEASAVQRFEASLSGFGIVWNYLAAVAVVFWILFYVVA
jgi:heme/copper-type cytochrome/quinol oxidase subunit 3